MTTDHLRRSSESDNCKFEVLGERVETVCEALIQSIDAQLHDREARFEKLDQRASASRKVTRIVEDVKQREEEIATENKVLKRKLRSLKKEKKARAKEKKNAAQSHNNNAPVAEDERNSTSSVNSSSQPPVEKQGVQVNHREWLHQLKASRGLSFALFPPRTVHASATLRLPAATASALEAASVAPKQATDARQVEASPPEAETARRAPSSGRRGAAATDEPLLLSNGVTIWGTPRPASRPGSSQLRIRLPPVFDRTDRFLQKVLSD